MTEAEKQAFLSRKRAEAQARASAPRMETAPIPMESAAPSRSDQLAEFLAKRRAERDVPLYESLGRGALQGGTFGFADELSGAAESLFGPKTYQRARDESRAAFERARIANPKTYLGGGLLGGLAVPIPGSGAVKGATLGARLAKGLATGAGIGALSGLGASEAKLSDLGGVARDVGTGAGFGLLGGAVAGGLGALRGKAATRVAEAAQETSDALLGKAQKTARRALAAERSAVQSAHRDLEVLRETAKGVGERAEKAKAFLATPEAEDLVAMVEGGKLISGPQRVAEKAALTAEREAAQALTTPEAIGKATEEFLATPLRSEVLPRVHTYATRSIPLAVGTALGGPAGSVAGMATAAALGAPGTALSKMAKSSRFAYGTWKAVQRLLGSDPEKFGPFAGPLIKAAERGTENLAATHAVLANRDPEYQKLLVQLMGEQGATPGAEQ